MSTAPHTRARTARVAGGVEHQAPNFGFGEGRPRRSEPRRVSPSAVARLPQHDVGGAVLGRMFELDEAAAQPVRAEFRATDLEIHVGLTARFRDLAPAGADLITPLP